MSPWIFEKTGSASVDWTINVAVSIYAFLLPIAQIALAIVILIHLPLGLWRRARRTAGSGVWVGSYLFGITTWMLGAAAALASFGWWGFIIGVLIFGIGIVPVGAIGAFFMLGMVDLGWSLVVMAAITWAARLLGDYWGESRSKKRDKSDAGLGPISEN